jgi:hypothetical protein
MLKILTKCCPYAILVLTFSGVRSFAADANLAVLQLQTGASFLALSSKLDDFQSLQCLTPKARQHLGNLQGNTALVQQRLEKQYQDYQAFVTRPMEGNGRCNGGFNSVAVESEKRRVRTAQMATQIHNLRAQLANAVDDDLVGAEIDMNDESDGLKCADQGFELYDEAELSGNSTQLSMLAFQTGVLDVEKRFKAYVAVNSGLKDDCGSLPSDLSKGLFVGPAGIGGVVGAVPRGKSKNGASTVTGEIRNDSLASGASSVSISAPSQLRDSASLKNMGSASRPRNEREAILAASSASRSIPGASQADSEEMKVRALISSKGGDLTANDSSPLAAMVGELSTGQGKAAEADRAPASVAQPSVMSVTADKISASSCLSGEFSTQVFVGGQIGEPGAKRLEVNLTDQSGLQPQIHSCPAGTQSHALAFSLTAAQRREHSGKEIFVYAVFKAKPGQPFLLSRSGSAHILAP